MANIYDKLAAIQKAIKVPKDLDNAFAGFKYRSAEGILEKLKPLLVEQNVVVLLTDVVEDHSEQSYVKSYARMINCEEPKEWIEVSALAREEKTRPKMSEGQLTGSASSYARKYALNGLLLLDDGKDPDSQDNTKRPAAKSTGTAKPRNASMKQIELLVNKVKWGLKVNDKDQILRFLENTLGKSLVEVKSDEVDEALTKIDIAIREAKVSNAPSLVEERTDIVHPDTGEPIDLDNLPY